VSLSRPSARSRRALRAGVAVLGLMAAGCSGAPGPAAPARPLTQQVANGRFTVTFSGPALQAARGAGLNLPAVVSRALERINAVLPGPHTTIAVGLGPPGTVIPQTGANGMTGRARAGHRLIQADIPGQPPDGRGGLAAAGAVP
jgi:hypothetical protein